MTSYAPDAGMREVIVSALAAALASAWRRQREEQAGRPELDTHNASPAAEGRRHGPETRNAAC